MSNALWIITGASKGLGRHLAEAALASGDSVAALSRTGLVPANAAPGRFRSWSKDLGEIEALEGWMEAVWKEFDPARFDAFYLVNNAAILDPFAKIEAHALAEIRANVDVNLTAPMALSAIFLARLRNSGKPRTLVNVGSGAAVRPVPAWSAYCATKAALAMYTRVAALEHAGDPLVRLLNFGPGVMDTAMQARIREQDEKDFPEVERFRERKRDGALMDPARVARALHRYVTGGPPPDRVDVSVSDLL